MTWIQALLSGDTQQNCVQQRHLRRQGSCAQKHQMIQCEPDCGVTHVCGGSLTWCCWVRRQSKWHQPGYLFNVLERIQSRRCYNNQKSSVERGLFAFTAKYGVRPHAQGRPGTSASGGGERWATAKTRGTWTPGASAAAPSTPSTRTPPPVRSSTGAVEVDRLVSSLGAGLHRI